MVRSRKVAGKQLLRSLNSCPIVSKPAGSAARFEYRRFRLLDTQVRLQLTSHVRKQKAVGLKSDLKRLL